MEKNTKEIKKQNNKVVSQLKTKLDLSKEENKNMALKAKEKSSKTTAIKRASSKKAVAKTEELEKKSTSATKKEINKKVSSSPKSSAISSTKISKKNTPVKVNSTSKKVAKVDSSSKENTKKVKSDTVTKMAKKVVSKPKVETAKKVSAINLSRNKITATTDKAETALGENANKDIKVIAEKTNFDAVEKREQRNLASVKKLKVLFVAGECQPFVATGGLGDVIGSLPKAIAKNNEVDVSVMLPLYASVKESYIEKLQFVCNFTTHLAWRQEYCGIFKLNQDNVTYYFVDNERYFKREKPYGFYDDGERFAYFCKSVVESLQVLNYFPDIIHCNDWQSALVSSYIKTGSWQDLRYYNIKNIYTIHNVEYQGIYGMENLSDLFGIDYKFKNFLEYNNDINLTKAAIQFSDKFTTVSESYCDNLKESYCSGGLNYIIIRNEYKLCGILNGIDYDFYNPKTDKAIYYNYDINSLDGKVKNKLALQKDLGLKQDKDIPLIAVVSRLVSHKGIGLLMKILYRVLEKNVQLIVVGTGDRWYVDYFKDLQNRHQDKVRVFVDKYYNDMARKAYAGSDIFLMPSKIEPCGISQMIASRYGSIPIVREVGGLKDSIKDFGCEGGGNGYTFTNYNAEDLYYQINKALEDYKNKKLFNDRVKIVMSKDFSWNNSAKKYLDLYKSLIK